MQRSINRAPRRSLVRKVVAEKRRQHPELGGSALEFAAVAKVLQREGCAIRWRARNLRLGMTIAFMGEAAIFLDPRLYGRALLEVTLHEMGHFHLHVFDRTLLRRSRAEEMSPIDRRCEAEADLYARMMLAGPGTVKLPALEFLDNLPIDIGQLSDTLEEAG